MPKFFEQDKQGKSRKNQGLNSNEDVAAVQTKRLMLFTVLDAV